MELTKNQIQFIDHRLENEGVKYWDIRIEMLDHVVSDIENKLTPETSEYDFKELVQDSFENLGWKENFNGSSFERVLKENYSNISLKNRVFLKEEFFTFFSNIQLLMVSVFFIIIYYFASTFASHKEFVVFSYILFLIPAIIFFYECIRLWRKKIGKSFHKVQSLNVLFFSFAIFNVFMLAMKSEGEDFAIPVEYQKPILLLLLPIHSFLSYIGYKMYKKIISKVELVRKQLL